jgi:hypothetical protein
VVPFFQLQNLLHFWKDADTPFLRRRQHLFTRDVCKVPANFKYLHARRLFKFDTVAQVVVYGWQRNHLVTHDDVTRAWINELALFGVLPQPLMDWKDRAIFVVWVAGKISVVSLLVNVVLRRIAVV